MTVNAPTTSAGFPARIFVDGKPLEGVELTGFSFEADASDDDNAIHFTAKEWSLSADFILDGDGAQNLREFLDRVAPKADRWKRWGRTRRVAMRRYATHVRRSRARLLAHRGAHDWALQQVALDAKYAAHNAAMAAYFRGEGEFPEEWA